MYSGLSQKIRHTSSIPKRPIFLSEEPKLSFVVSCRSRACFFGQKAIIPHRFKLRCTSKGHSWWHHQDRDVYASFRYHPVQHLLDLRTPPVEGVSRTRIHLRPSLIAHHPLSWECHKMRLNLVTVSGWLSLQISKNQRLRAPPLIDVAFITPQEIV